MQKIDSDVSSLEDPRAQLERSLIDGHLIELGHDPQSVKSSNDEKSRRLLAEATKYAGERLAEVECRAHYVHDIHGTK